jgi:tetraacyldisaccharide 4'-kinase
MRAWLESVWYGAKPSPLPLRALAALYGGLAAAAAARRRRRARQLPVPVIVVGNITAGGTGKTPLVVHLAEILRQRGLRAGVISRGYGGRAPRYPLRVTANTDVRHSGDEPALIARRSGVPVAVAPDRVAAAKLLLDEGGIDVLIADDGLQHYRLARAAEICVVDGARGLGNGRLLPAGPLREPPARLDSVDLIVVNGGGWRPASSAGVPIIDMHMAIADAIALGDGRRRSLADFAGKHVHAVAGIGHPERFFASLRQKGINVLPHPFPDHHRFSAVDLNFPGDHPVLMTEKDAVKCRSFARDDCWEVPAAAVFDATAAALVQQLFDRIGLAGNTGQYG